MIEADALADLVREHLRWESYSPGCAVVVVDICSGRRAALGAGRASPASAMLPTTPFMVGCGLKPVVACATARLLETEGIAFDEPVGRYCDLWSRRPDSPTFHQLVAHTAGLGRPAGFELRIAAKADRADLVRRAVEGWAGPAPQYSEAFMALTLGRIVRDLTGATPQRWLNALLADEGIAGMRFGLAGWTSSQATADLGLYHDMREEPGRALPLAHEVLPSSLHEPLFGLINVASPAATADWYARLGRHLTADAPSALFPSRAGWADLVAHRRTAQVDEVLERDLGFSCALVSDFGRELQLGRWGDELLGHWGWTGSSVAFVDPVRGVSVALQVNSLVDGRLEYLERRALLFDALAGALDGG
ncbi:MAG: serine hydrolase [Acidimicrobiales bacterium]|nr:serine hydrolase [Acidimicrobiales bacterium]